MCHKHCIGLRAIFSTSRMNIGLVALWGFISFFGILVARVDGCSPPNGWTYLTDSERAQRAGLVVYGTVVQSPRSGPKAKGSHHRDRHYKAVFEVHCVFKGPKLPQFINVSGFGHVPGLCTNSKAYVNRTYVVFLKGRNVSSRKFRVNEVNVQVGTIEVRTKAQLKEIIRSVGENSLSLPIGTSNRSEPGCTKLRQCTEVYKKRARKRNHKKRKCCRKNCPPRNTRAPESTFLPTTLKETHKLRFTGDFVPAFRVSETASSRSAGCLSKHWFHVLTLHGPLLFVLLTWLHT